MPRPAYPFAGQSEPSDEDSALTYRRYVEHASKSVHRLPKTGDKAPITPYVVVPMTNSYYYDAAQSRTPSPSPPVYPVYKYNRYTMGYKLVQHRTPAPSPPVYRPVYNYYGYGAAQHRKSSPLSPVKYYIIPYGYDAAQKPTSSPSPVLGGSTQDGCEEVTSTSSIPEANNSTNNVDDQGNAQG